MLSFPRSQCCANIIIRLILFDIDIVTAVYYSPIKEASEKRENYGIPMFRYLSTRKTALLLRNTIK